MSTNVEMLRDKRIAVLNWRDVHHPQAGGAEQYMHRIARLWVAAGAHVTWLTARPDGHPAHCAIDGVDVVRTGGQFTVYPRVATILLSERDRFDAVVDCQNGIPFFAPFFVRSRTPVVQVVHHVHQDQFSDRFPPPVAMFGRFLEGTVARRAYGRRTVVAVSPSTRAELRQRLRMRGPIAVVPNGVEPPVGTAAPRAENPTIVVVSRLVPHKRLDRLVDALPEVVSRVPDLHVDIVGDGVESARLRRLVHRRDLERVVTLHGHQPDRIRDEILDRAWLTVSASAGEGWGCSVVEAASRGVPCLAVESPGVRDSVVEGRTGWLVGSVDALAGALVFALEALSDADVAAAFADRCRAWAACFTWERGAELLAGVVIQELAGRQSRQRRVARPDIAAVVRCRPAVAPLTGRLRCTDEVVTDQQGVTTMLLGGCDDRDAVAVAERVGREVESVRLADRYDLLLGPNGRPAEFGPSPAASGRL
ncbi:glycosyltransferase family 4 protein [Saccharothrix obliqua]|uniref:glycosyltransferase family 4 protein n=1 Tax=Saccharothrix obliqua TaxID=2861747 RepID=UPI001C600B72|nr:glycosyltransferase family 4 protein [Saccharothrix obliqua]MBW4718135.1 glycosyltransferase family 4 protein [Saccharothrix obliqua]